MVTVYGMNDKVGNISYYDPQQENTFTKPFSEETGKMIDEEVRKLIESAFVRTKALLTQKKNEVEILAKELLKREVLFQSDVEALIGKRTYKKKKASNGRLSKYYILSLEPRHTLLLLQV